MVKGFNLTFSIIRLSSTLMIKERTFHKKVTIDNFKELKVSSLHLAEKGNSGKAVRETATVTAEVFYTPKGFRCEAELPDLFTWDFSQACRIIGISEALPDGDLLDKNFETMLAAMHFITRRLRKLGWEPQDNWHDRQ